MVSAGNGMAQKREAGLEKLLIEMEELQAGRFASKGGIFHACATSYVAG